LKSRLRAAFSFVPGRAIMFFGTFEGIRRLLGMTGLTHQMAATHDHWFEDTGSKSLRIAMQFRWSCFGGGVSPDNILLLLKQWNGSRAG
jgi:hypothetical protein